MLIVLRLKAWMYRHRMKPIAKLFDIIVRILWKCDFPASVKFGKGLSLSGNGRGTVVHFRAILGQDVIIGQSVTIGSRNNIGPPIIGEYVKIGDGACVLGDIRIGDYVIIAPGAVVIHDTPNNCYVAGVPAKIIEQ